MRSSRWLKIALACVWTISLASPAEAAPGDLSRDFGDQGKVVTDVGGIDSIRAVAVGPRIVAAGFSALLDPYRQDMALAVYDAAGSLDSTFDGDGLIVRDLGGDYDGAADVLITESGEYLVLAHGARDDGVPLGFLLLYGSTGALDLGFGTGGIVALPNFGPAAFAVQPDGKILVAGQPVRRGYGFALRRFLADGRPDPAFGGGDGKVATQFKTRDGVFQPHVVDVFVSRGKVTVAGWTYFPGTGYRTAPALARYRSSGALDPRFGTGGRVIGEASTGTTIAAGLQSAGRIVVASSFAAGGLFCAGANTTDVLLRFDRRGDEDATFGRHGRRRVGYIVSALAIDADDRIVVAGVACPSGRFTFAVSRFTVGGNVDRRFGRDGTALTGFGTDVGATTVVARPRDRILAGGNTMTDFLEEDFALVEYLA